MTPPILKTTRERPPNMTLCWFCRNAVPSPITGAGCSWSIEDRPVEGWDAQRRDVLMHDGRSIRLAESYRVRACPEFVKG